MKQILSYSHVRTKERRAIRREWKESKVGSEILHVVLLLATTGRDDEDGSYGVATTSSFRAQIASMTNRRACREYSRRERDESFHVVAMERSWPPGGAVASS